MPSYEPPPSREPFETLFVVALAFIVGCVGLVLLLLSNAGVV